MRTRHRPLPGARRRGLPRGYDVLATGENQTVVQSGTPGERRTMTGADQVMKVKCR
jgi:hypothetical protein